jgi:hypothetical protein
MRSAVHITGTGHPAQHRDCLNVTDFTVGEIAELLDLAE